MMSGLWIRRECIMDRPFHDSMKEFHQIMSDRAARLRRRNVLDGRLCEILSRSMRRRRKVRPGRIITLASCSEPTRDCKSLFLQDFRRDHLWSIVFKRSSFCVGSLSSKRVVSTSIPKKFRHVTGPSRLSAASGKPRSSQVSTSRSKFCLHSCVWGCPVVTKSSR